MSCLLPMQDLIEIRPDSIVVAGGNAMRLGGIDKAMLPLGETGAALLSDVVNACPGRVFVLGPQRNLELAQIIWLPDLNPGSGPAAGIWSGLAHVDTEYVFISAADQTLSKETVNAIVAAAQGQEGAWAIRSDGAGQPLCACVRLDRLRELLAPTQGINQSPLRLLSNLQMVGVSVKPGQVVDFDTWNDVAKAAKESKSMDQITQMWLARVAAILEVDQHEVPVAELLDLTREVAHGVERKSAPLTTFLLGYAAGAKSLKADEISNLITVLTNAVTEWETVD
ncbi:MAG: NTP transferase domain-containing protein [Actinobacteria bacterium]|nr:NTP transferase domain-containing protein [Actinomycetota bacterium]MSW25076.1 NTP transferase domain-containing protein [Actinomycetota bacterium]MSX29466.1 NTP transferase domain-containing protein [Actinomycetota bacterium]MSX43594.1 NTP transferase domain-containing protein [Actinomycetota bacterium]MSX97372.1 NTP transferase domain-containing protein [Actinomycetota bacterium]